MGDSITEGTLVAFEKKIGDFVSVDDVIAVIETDKVAVEVRADAAGTITALHCAIDENIAVGALLATLESGGAAAASVAAPAAAPATAAPLTAAAPAAPAHDAVAARVPSIKFVGKRSLLAAAPVAAPAGGVSPASAPPKQQPKALAQTTTAADDADFLKYGAFYGRPHLSAAEIDAVDSGGATLGL
ncbi:single hybrid motif-containing protein [Pelagophyceae sp. CCMP2097]|nr:single hybrid motif-containing protein [Pelagophyceae sp. CCMP2097]